MKFLLIALLSTLTGVTGQLLTLNSLSFTPAVAPEMVVYYVNQQAASTACTATELLYIDSKILPDLDMTLMANNYQTPDWGVTEAAATRKLTGTTTSTANCDFCRTRFPKNLCNSMFNCKMRRQLRKGPSDERDLKSLADLAEDLLDDCQDNIEDLSDNRNLSLSCRRAIRAATCHVEFV